MKREVIKHTMNKEMALFVKGLRCPNDKQDENSLSFREISERFRIKYPLMSDECGIAGGSITSGIILCQVAMNILREKVNEHGWN